MSNSNLYGSRDRRVPVTGMIWDNVKPVYDRIFDEADFLPPSRATDKESRWYLEQWSYDHAVRELPEEERVKIENLAHQLESRLGKGAGRGTALQILARLGVFFSLNNYGGK